MSNLVQGQTKLRLEVEVDYENGTDMTAGELATATKKIQYKWIKNEGTDTTTTEWTATGYGTYSDGTPYIYYVFTSTDAVPVDADMLVGRAKITHADSRVSLGKKFSVKVDPDELDI
jgi:hypothetical protein